MVVEAASGVEESTGDTVLDGRGTGWTERMDEGRKVVVGELALRRWCRVGLETGHSPWVLIVYVQRLYR